MRLRDYTDRDGKRVWLDRDELGRITNQPDDPERRAALLLAGRCGLRRDEIVDVAPEDIVDTSHGTVVRVWEGKGDKYREPAAPSELAHIALQLERDRDEPLVDASGTTVYRWIRQAAEQCDSDDPDQGWEFVGPHDLRRSWGVLLLEQGVVPSVVMEWGGWDDWDTFRDHYLAEFSPEALRRERGKVEWFEGERRVDDDLRYGVIETGD